MFHINSITVPPGYSSAIFGGSGGNFGPRSPRDRFGPEGSVYFISAPGLGSLYIEDIGAVGDGWGVRVNGRDDLVWTYVGEGQGAISIDINGNFTITGGTNSVSATLVVNMADSGPLTARIFQMVQASASLRSAWNTDAMQVLYQVGLPRTCMHNMDPNCCAQYMAQMRSIQFPASAAGLAAVTDSTDPEFTGWFACALCQAGLAGVVAAAFVAFVGILTSSVAAAAAPLQAVQEATTLSTIVNATGISAGRLIQLAASAFVGAGVVSFVGNLIELICEEIGACS